ncbi:AbiH family protein [Deferribacteres bacterium DY0037]
MHGVVGSELLIGHGDDNFNEGYYEARYAGSEEGVSATHKALRKKTHEALDANMSFFTNLENIDKIYSFGFSFSDVDMIYIGKICEVLSTENITWYLSSYETDQIREEHKNNIRKYVTSSR